MASIGLSLTLRLGQTLTHRQSLVVRLAVEDAQNGKEEVDDVEVKADGGSNFLLDMVMAQDKLRVDKDIATENKSCEAAIDEFTGRAVWEKHGHETEDDETPEGAEEVRHPRGEVILGLAGEKGKEDEDSGSKNDSIEYDGRLVEGHYNGNGVGFGKSKE